MIRSEIEEKLKQLFNNSLTPSELSDLVDIAESEGTEIADLNDIESLYNMIGKDIDLPEESSVDHDFYAMLEEQKAINKGPVNLSPGIMIRIAAGIALFIMGWFGSQLLNRSGQVEVVSQLTDEVSDLRESLVLTKLQQNSPSERIQAVSMAGEMTSLDDKIINGLLTTLNNDPNDNVRLLALETLTNYADNDLVMEGIISSIEFQSSPLIQLRMAQLMVALEERRSVQGFIKILEDLTLDYNVRSRLTETVEVLL